MGIFPRTCQIAASEDAPVATSARTTVGISTWWSASWAAASHSVMPLRFSTRAETASESRIRTRASVSAPLVDVPSDCVGVWRSVDLDQFRDQIIEPVPLELSTQGQRWRTPRPDLARLTTSRCIASPSQRIGFQGEFLAQTCAARRVRSRRQVINGRQDCFQNPRPQLELPLDRLLRTQGPNRSGLNHRRGAEAFDPGPCST